MILSNFVFLIVCKLFLHVKTYVDENFKTPNLEFKYDQKSFVK